MVEFFADSLLSGFSGSSAMGRGIVLVQICTSIVMFTFIFGKWRELIEQRRASRRVARDVMGGRTVIDHYLQRRVNGHTVLENIYWSSIERLLKLFSPDVRNQLLSRQPNAATALTTHEMGLVKSLCEHVLDEESIRVEKGMGMIATVVAIAPMLGLLGTVWGVLDAFAEMGAAGSANLATIAPSISSALVTTVVGLIVAIPGTALFTRLNASIRSISADMEGFADELVGRIACEYQGKGA